MEITYFDWVSCPQPFTGSCHNTLRGVQTLRQEREREMGTETMREGEKGKKKESTNKEKEEEIEIIKK